VIGRLSGVVVEHASDGSCVLDVNGVGYEVFVPIRSFGKLQVGAKGTLHVHTHVREEALTLYGFDSGDDREAFRILMSVSGVGPKVALAVLAELTAADLASAVSRGDRRRLEAISGVGKKTAARLLLELKDKLGAFAGSGALKSHGATAVFTPLPLGDVPSQVCDALTRLGFSRAQAEAAVAAQIHDAGAPPQVEQLLRQALATLG
jgi:Holliday junction DNA helicase RuvA